MGRHRVDNNQIKWYTLYSPPNTEECPRGRDGGEGVPDFDDRRYFIVAEYVLPDAIKKTAEVKELLVRGEARTVNDAVEKVGMSRSAFYKYRDGVFPFHRAVHNRIVTLSMVLNHKAGVLSTILNTIAAEQGNVLTINQGIPLQGLANATISIDTTGMTVSIETLLRSISLIKGVQKVEIIGET